MANPFLDGIGKILGKVTEWIPGRNQNLKDQQDQLLREEDEILKQHPQTPARTARLIVIADKLREIRGKLKNAVTN